MTEKRYKSVGANLECSNGKEYMLVKRDDGFNVCQVCSKYTAKEIVDELNNLADENKQLKERNQELFDDLQYKTSLLSLRGGELAILKKENEELKQQNADWETSFDICKHYKEAYGTEIVKIKQTIKNMMENERTELGRSVLRQLWEAIQ